MSVGSSSDGRSRRNTLAACLGLVVLTANWACEPPQFIDDTKPELTELCGRWRLDYTGMKLGDSAKRTTVTGSGIEELDLRPDGTFVQSFRGPGGYSFTGKAESWTLEHSRPGRWSLRLSNSLPFYEGLEVAQHAGSALASTIWLVAEGGSEKPWGRPTSWTLSFTGDPTDPRRFQRVPGIAAGK